VLCSVADDDCTFRAERRDQTADISTYGLERVGLDCERFVAAAIAAHVRRSNAIARVCERRDLVVLRIPALGKAMDQYDKGACSGQCHTEADAVGVDILQVRSHGAVPD
jgi:hypothetical protein